MKIFVLIFIFSLLPMINSDAEESKTKPINTVISESRCISEIEPVSDESNQDTFKSNGIIMKIFAVIVWFILFLIVGIILFPKFVLLILIILLGIALLSFLVVVVITTQVNKIGAKMKSKKEQRRKNRNLK